MDTGLNDWLAKAPFLEWKWGETDCTMWVADWCVIRFGHDPARMFRGTYGTEEQARDLVAGGLANLISPFMPPLREKTSPAPGDVGVILLAGRETSAIFNGKLWAIRTERGLFEGPLKPIKIWGL